jgi:Protein of unknown function (DUF4058)
MPLRDHFDSPVADKHAWNELHAMWPAMIVQQLYRLLPEGFVAAPSVHLSKDYEIDIGVSEEYEREPIRFDMGEGGVATATEAATAVAPHPTLTIDTELPEEDEFEVRIYDTRLGRDLVAAIELVSPRNKDRPESRRAFVGKVAALLQQGICVSIVDLVTNRHFSLYAELLEFLGRSDPSFGPTPPHLYAVTLRGRKLESRKPVRGRSRLDLWHYPMAIGQPLPTLPIWLEPELRVLLPLETGYEETCKLLHIR